MAVDHERYSRREYEDYIDRPRRNYDSGIGGAILGLLALVAILGLLFFVIGSSPDGAAPRWTTERTVPTPNAPPAQQSAPPAPSPALK